MHQSERFKLKNQTKEYGLADEGFSTQAALFDYDLDGLLDVYIVNHSVFWFKPLPLKYAKKRRVFPNQDRLYRNIGNGKFSNVSDQCGLIDEVFGGYGLGVSISDIDPDIYATNDYEGPDFIYINNGDGTFTESLQ